MTHYKLTEKTKDIGYAVLHRIELIEDCKWGKKGDKGGWIEKQSNLTGDAWVYGDAWVSGNAEVFGDARVYGDALVYGDARVYGDAWEQSPLQIKGSKHYLNECKEGYLKIGCIEKSFTDWQEHFEEIGKNNGYTESK
jgi:hypothetical protein